MSSAPSTTAQRVRNLRAWLQDSEADALLVSNDYNRRYLSGFTGTSGWLLIGAADALLITDSRYTEQAGKQAPDFTVAPLTGKLDPLLLDLCAQHGFKRLAFESEHISVDAHSSYSESLAGEIDLIGAKGVVEKLRVAKEPAEVAALRRAIAIADDAMPHHRPGDDVIPGNAFIVMDFGCIAGGYCSDMTRTVALGAPPPEMREIYRLVLHAQETAANNVRAGMSGKEADALAREIIKAAGHLDHFGHGLGHGVGLEIHEAPRLSPLVDDTPLPAGAVVSIEPGVYLPGVGGVRIEDLVLLREDGADVLTQSPKPTY